MAMFSALLSPPVILTALCCYLLGSIPFGYILIRIFRGQDVRKTGSGNIGATNVARSSPVLGLWTLCLDAAKGVAAVSVGNAIFHRAALGQAGLPLSSMLSLAALCAVLGHLFPVWLAFRGGKGVATAVGAFGTISPYVVLAAAGIFVVVLLATRYVSLSSVIAAACFPLLDWYMDPSHSVLPMGLTSALIIARHHQNIRRLLAGTERRLQWRRA